jgi:DNA processing protein
VNESSNQRLLRLSLKLHLAEGVGAVTFRRLTKAFEGIEGVWDASPRQWRQVEGVGEKTAAAIASVTDDAVEEELEEARRRGVNILCASDADYPEALRSIHDPPSVLYVRGSLRATDALAVGVVGSRRCTHYGMEQGERFGQLLGRAGFTLISGGARGIDTAAHRGALAGNGRTVAVMGCGLSSEYPPENSELFERIVSEDRGAIVSELPMHTAVVGRNFPMRNRIISGLSLGVLVVEAARRSGSLITARVSAEQGRVVFALPGRVDSPLSQGANELIRDGAILVQNLDDVLEHLGEVGEKMSVEEPNQTEELLPPNLDASERTLLEALAEGARSLDELVRQTGLPSGKAASILTMLVLRGLVEQRPGNVFARKRRKRAGDREIRQGS